MSIHSEDRTLDEALIKDDYIHRMQTLWNSRTEEMLAVAQSEYDQLTGLGLALEPAIKLWEAPIWVDAQTFTFTPAATGTGDTWYNARTADVSSVTALDNNPNVAFRVVSAFDPIAGDYVASRSTSTYGGGTSRFDMVTITSNTTLGVSQFETNKNDFRVYPNPANKEIVTFNQTQDIEVFDTLGKLVLKAKNTNTLDTKSFHSGIYFIKTGSGLTRKLVVR
jgi:hypothetical protein